MSFFVGLRLDWGLHMFSICGLLFSQIYVSLICKFHRIVCVLVCDGY